MGTAVRDWQIQSIEALRGLRVERMPAAELVFLDALAVSLMGPATAGRPDAGEPWTIEHGTVVVGHLLRALTVSDDVEIDVTPGERPDIEGGRAAVVAGAHRFAERGGPGVQQLVGRFLAAAVGELEIHRESPEAQVRSLFCFGLMAVASGPENAMTPAVAEAIAAAFAAWDAEIGSGFVPPWRA